MADKIAVNDVKLKYTSLADARKMDGLRLILGEVAVPGPWREACKGIFHVKKIPFTPVASAGADGSQRELIEWTAQASAPVAIWNDERPRSTWIEQLYPRRASATRARADSGEHRGTRADVRRHQ